MSRAVARLVIKTLRDRKGFDWWWSEIDKDDRLDIIEEVGEVIARWAARDSNPEPPD